jgi:hypothetical protein
VELHQPLAVQVVGPEAECGGRVKEGDLSGSPLSLPSGWRDALLQATAADARRNSGEPGTAGAAGPNSTLPSEVQRSTARIVFMVSVPVLSVQVTLVEPRSPPSCSS